MTDKTDIVEVLEKMACFFVNRSPIASGEELGHAKDCDYVKEYIEQLQARIDELEKAIDESLRCKISCYGFRQPLREVTKHRSKE